MNNTYYNDNENENEKNYHPEEDNLDNGENSLIEAEIGELYSIIKKKCDEDVMYILDKPKSFNIYDFIELIKKYFT